MTPRPVLALAFLLLPAAGCGPAPGPTPDPGPAGCWRFERNRGAELLGLPWGVVLSDDPLSGRWPLMERLDDVRLARSAPSPGERAEHPFGYWRRVGSDSLEIGHPGGGGVVLTVSRRDGELVGRGRDAGDVLLPGETPGAREEHPVRAVRVPCGEIPPA